MKILISLPDELVAHLNGLADMRGRSNLIERLLLQALGAPNSKGSSAWRSLEMLQLWQECRRQQTNT